MPAIGIGIGLPFSGPLKWTPKRIPGLKGWWSAEDALTSIGPDTPAAIGQTVRRVLDRSGYGRHLNQVTGNAQPTLSYLNGVDADNGVALAGDGINDLIGSTAFEISSNRTTVNILSMESGLLVNQFGDSWADANGGFLGGDNTFETISVQRGGTNVLGRGAATGNMLNGLGMLVIIAQFANYKAGIKAWRNGVEVALDAGYGTDGSVLSGAVPFHLFGRPFQSVQGKGLIAETMVFEGHLTETHRSLITDYAFKKYSL